jgi:hypothetical protein
MVCFVRNLAHQYNLETSSCSGSKAWLGTRVCGAGATSAWGHLCYSDVVVNEFIEASGWTGCLGASGFAWHGSGQLERWAHVGDVNRPLGWIWCRTRWFAMLTTVSIVLQKYGMELTQPIGNAKLSNQRLFAMRDGKATPSDSDLVGWPKGRVGVHNVFYPSCTPKQFSLGEFCSICVALLMN